MKKDKQVCHYLQEEGNERGGIEKLANKVKNFPLPL
jgi:hypothetical protein